MVVTKITGNQQLDTALTDLFALTDDEERLKAAKKVVEDKQATLDLLTKHLTPSVIQMAASLAGEDTNEILKGIDNEDVRNTLKRAFKLLQTHFSALPTHPSIVASMRRELEELSPARDDGDNTITGIGWEPTYAEHEGKLVPLVSLRLRGELQKLLLISKLDWDDLIFLIDATSDILHVHMRKSLPIAEVGLLSTAGTEKVEERLKSAIESLTQASELGKKLGIFVKE